MKTFHKFESICLLILFASGFLYGQKEASKAIVNQKNEVAEAKKVKPNVVSPDGTLIAKNIRQRRDITQYIDGGNLRCGVFTSENECDEKKLNDFIWLCWTKRERGYISVQYSSVDASSTEHIFIEPNKINQWQIVRRLSRSHTLLKAYDKVLELPLIFSVEKVRNDKNEQLLIYKDKLGKVINDF